MTEADGVHECSFMLALQRLFPPLRRQLAVGGDWHLVVGDVQVLSLRAVLNKKKVGSLRPALPRTETHPSHCVLSSFYC